MNHDLTEDPRWPYDKKEEHDYADDFDFMWSDIKLEKETKN